MAPKLRLMTRLMTRRHFLLIFLGAGLFITTVSGLAYQYRRYLYRRYLQLRLDESSPTGVLSPEEFRIITALFETIAPQPAPSTEELREFVNWRTSTIDGYYREYKSAAALLDSKAQACCGAGFAALTRPRRDDVLRGLLPRHTFLPLQEGLPFHETEPSLIGKIRVAWELFLFNAAARFKYFVFWDLLSLYWLSGIGWAAVGYSSYPGTPDPQRTYTAPLARVGSLSPEPLSRSRDVDGSGWIAERTSV
jgi:hypothetical protein